MSTNVCMLEVLNRLLQVHLQCPRTLCPHFFWGDVEVTPPHEMADVLASLARLRRSYLDSASITSGHPRMKTSALFK